jgi:hypothetical protein
MSELPGPQTSVFKEQGVSYLSRVIRRSTVVVTCRAPLFGTLRFTGELFDATRLGTQSHMRRAVGEGDKLRI